MPRKPNRLSRQVLCHQGNEAAPAGVIIPQSVVHLRLEHHRRHHPDDPVRAPRVILVWNVLVKNVREEPRLRAGAPGDDQHLQEHSHRHDKLEPKHVPQRPLHHLESREVRSRKIPLHAFLLQRAVCLFFLVNLLLLSFGRIEHAHDEDADEKREAKEPRGEAHRHDDGCRLDAVRRLYRIESAGREVGHGQSQSHDEEVEVKSRRLQCLEASPQQSDDQIEDEKPKH